MSENIQVSKAALDERLDKVITEVDALDRAIAGVPDAPDAGIASEIIGFAMAAAVDGAATTADGYRALIAVARDVLVDFEHHEQGAVAELANLERAVQGDT